MKSLRPVPPAPVFINVMRGSGTSVLIPNVPVDVDV